MNRAPGGTSRVFIVDWLGRGGIAHTSETWHRELRDLGCEPTLLTRGGRELSEMVPEAQVVISRFGPLAEHLQLVAKAHSLLRSSVPSWLVIQGTVVPLSELALLRSARRLGVRTCVVAHEAVPSRKSPRGLSAYAACLESADLVIVHTRFVKEEVLRLAPSSRTVRVPLPKTDCLVRARATSSSVLPNDERPTVLGFGQLDKRYKGVDLFTRLAEQNDTWRFALVGTGIPGDLDHRIVCHRGFLPAGMLAATVAEADVVLLPYKRASQSGAVVLAQEVGTPVVASAVGGVPEQITDGESGLLVEPNAGTDTWQAALARLTDSTLRRRLSRGATLKLDQQHETFRRFLATTFVGGQS